MTQRSPDWEFSEIAFLSFFFSEDVEAVDPCPALCTALLFISVGFEQPEEMEWSILDERIRHLGNAKANVTTGLTPAMIASRSVITYLV
jgi:hypothetical protein